MATFDFVQPPPNSTGKKVRGAVVDTDKLIPLSVIADPDDAAAVAKVDDAPPAANAFGLTVRIPEPGTPVLTQPAQNDGTSVLVAANANRRWCSIENDPQDGLADLFVALAATATAAARSFKLKPGEYREIRNYTGVISGIWSAAGSGSAKVTEVSQ